MASTTIELSVETRDANRFWADAEAAATWQSSLSVAERQRRQDAVAEIDRAFDGIG